MTEIQSCRDMARVNSAVGDRLFCRRKALGYSGQQVAADLGISQQQLSRYERGQSRINVGMLVRAADILQTPVGWFFAGCQDNSLYEESLSIQSDIYTAASVTSEAEYTC
ncbi:helix-turn-helix domain-containing protein [Morganella morganii]|uniref:helix-turn-helix domain-containing protein n=1 Tax=Morganella morganii TaxID=582 RepID=UPI00128DE94F|nr:helix-turn-helix transcriptional regulator [Morganella morganii]MQC07085.1 XRE family transcriptional regulator [Morganella morganii]MQC11246.1 XRE family transcriptional regulator [Morganella morganii]MQC15174.1 XRE family transcriptional regulator [Morganella morganii]